MASTSTTVPDIDVLDPHFYDHPWDGYRWLRENDPVHWDARNELWVISTYEDLRHIETNPEIWSSAQGVRPRLDVPMSIIAMDDPEHFQQRRLINRGFTPRMVGRIADHVREVTASIIDDVAERGEIDFVEELAMHVPLIVIAELMGLPTEDHETFFKWSDAMMSGDGHQDPDDPVLIRAAEAFGEFVTYAQALFEAKRANPGEDIISILLGANDEGGLIKVRDGDDLQSDALLMFMVLLVVAGNETTRNALTGGLMAFSRYPEQREKFIAGIDDPDVVNRAVEEVLRYVSPVISFCRTLTRDHTYKGREMKAGQKVLVLYQSANRDEAVFENPEAFDISREPNNHLAFGVGPHFCLGANLARMEIRIVFEMLFRRLPDIRMRSLDVYERGENTLVICLEHLDAVFTPQPSAS